jgi:hypothetical protein
MPKPDQQQAGLFRLIPNFHFAVVYKVVYRQTKPAKTAPIHAKNT